MPRRPTPDSSQNLSLARSRTRGRLLTLWVGLGLLAGATPLQAQSDSDDKDLPLAEDRRVRIDMSVGSWMSVDVSPDGQTVVFDHLGDLFSVPISGGDATRLTSDMAFDAQPRFSPDGSSIVFTSDRSGGQNVWVMSLDGSDTTQITQGATNRTESPDWAPDGSYVVYSKGGFRGGGLPKLWMSHIDGGSGVALIDEPNNLKTLGAAFSPDGRTIWFARRTGDWTYNAQLPQYQLAVYDRETGDTFTRSSRYGSAFRPTLSPDGRWLAYGTRHEDETGLRLRDLESGDERWLAYPVQHDDQESRGTLDVLPGMSFTPDSRHLVASYEGKLWKLPIAGGAAEEIPFRVNYDLALGPKVEFEYPIPDTPTFTVRQIRDGVASPDGSKIAFSALDRLWVANADGSDPERLTDSSGTEHQPAWSPDGRWLAYVTWDENGGHVVKARSNGSGASVRLTAQSAIYVSPAWSPDGQRVVALRGAASGFRESAGGFGGGSPQPTEIVWLDADEESGAATIVAPVDGRLGPHFTDSSDRIYLFRRPDALVSIRWDGSDERVHVRVRGETPPGAQNASSPSALRMAPRGDQVLALIERQLYTTTVPRVGAEPPTINVGNPSGASFPSRKLTRMGGEFPSWGADGRTVHWSLGRAWFTYDLDEASAAEEAAEAAAEDPDEADEDADEEEAGYEAAELMIDIAANRDTPQGTAVLRGARLITMRGAEVIENGEVLVENNRIVAVGAAGTLDVPSSATVLDVSGKTIVPGFVDTHAHMRPSGVVHRSDVWPYLANLAYGVTTTRDPQTGTTDVLSYADRVRTGELIGPRVYSTGPGVFWQHGIGSEREAKRLPFGVRPSTSTPKRSRCTWPVTDRCVSGSSWPPASWS